MPKPYLSILTNHASATVRFAAVTPELGQLVDVPALNRELTEIWNRHHHHRVPVDLLATCVLANMRIKGAREAYAVVRRYFESTTVAMNGRGCCSYELDGRYIRIIEIMKVMIRYYHL